MKKLLVILLSISALHAMQPGNKKWPKDIYEAIKKNNQAAIDYYISRGQVNISDEPDRDSPHDQQEYTCLCEKSCCCTFPIPPCCIPLPCSSGRKKLTPLYVAISTNNLEAARKLFAAGARLNVGMWEKHDESCYWRDCFYGPSYQLHLKSNALKLATLACKRSDAKNLLQVAVQQNRPLLDSSFPAITSSEYTTHGAIDGGCDHTLSITKTNCSNELCNALIALKDPQLLATIMQNQLIPPAMLACAAAQKRKTRDLLNVISQYHGPINVELLEQLCIAIAKTGDQRLVDIALQDCPNCLPTLLRTVAVNHQTNLINYLLGKNPSLAVIDTILLNVRNITVANQLLAYRAHVVNQLPAPVHVPNAQPFGQQPLSVPGELLNSAPEYLIHSQVISQTNQSQASSSNGDACAICCEPLISSCDIKTLPCGHNFHGTCISEWFKHKRICPLCMEKS